MNREEILAKYKLSDELHDEIYDKIKKLWTAGKHPVEKPVAMVVGGQTGSGKTSILTWCADRFADGNIVVINSDDIKPFHPDIVEIAKNYPSLFTAITDQESNTWTSRLFGELRKEGYNLVFEGTMWNNRIADDAIAEMQSLGYTVIVCGVATGELESRLSVIERYIAEIEAQGYGRLVYDDHHTRTYNGMPNTIEYIEQTGKYSLLDVLMRGASPAEPILIYSHYNPEHKEETIRLLSEPNIVHLPADKNENSFASGKEAILTARTHSDYQTLKSFERRLLKIIEADNIEVLTQIKPLLEAYERVLNENGIDSKKALAEIKLKIYNKIQEMVESKKISSELAEFGDEICIELGLSQKS